MTTRDLFTLLLKFLGVATIFWAIKSFAFAQISSTPVYANSSSANLAIVDLAAGVILIFMAPLITSGIYPQHDAQ